MRETLERLGVDFDSLEPFRDGMWLAHGSGEAVGRAWFVLDGERDQTGVSPMILGRLEHLLEALAGSQDPLDTPAILEQAAALDGKAVLQQRLKNALSYFFGPEAEIPVSKEILSVNWDDLQQDATALELNSLYTLWDWHHNTVSDRACLLLVPDPNDSHTHAHLRYGNWNDYPKAAEHVAILRHWREVHGARLVAFGPDYLEFRLEQPISDPSTAFRLAQEHFAYTTDAVFQGAQTMQALTKHLMQSNTWFLWWD